MNIRIREAEAGDAPVLTQLFCDYYEELKQCGMYYELNRDALPDVVRMRIRSGMVCYYVAECEEEICAFLIATGKRLGSEYHINGAGTVGHLQELYVVPEYRGRGVAGELLSSMQAWLAESGIFAVELNVLADNRGAHALYTSRRFLAKPAGTFYYKQYEEAED